MWFTKLLRTLVKHLRERLGYRILPYIDDFGGLCAVAAGKDIDKTRLRARR